MLGNVDDLWTNDVKLRLRISIKYRELDSEWEQTKRRSDGAPVWFRNWESDRFLRAARPKQTRG